MPRTELHCSVSPVSGAWNTKHKHNRVDHELNLYNLYKYIFMWSDDT